MDSDNKRHKQFRKKQQVRRDSRYCLRVSACVVRIPQFEFRPVIIHGVIPVAGFWVSVSDWEDS